MNRERSLAELNEALGSDGLLSFKEGKNGLQAAVLSHPSGASAEVYATGAHVSSWRSGRTASDLLYLSPAAEFAPGKSIRGGVPLIFPQFGPGLLPSHGFARSTVWTFDRALAADTGPSITLSLDATDATLEVWPYSFHAEYEITLLDSALDLRFRVANDGRGELFFQLALHTYFAVGDISKVSVLGLQHRMFLDNLKARHVGTEHRDRITIDAEVDRIYLQAPRELVIDDPTLTHRISIRSADLPDAVLWNPWVEKEKSMKDLSEGAHRSFVCVESGAIGAPIRLGTGERFEALVTYTDQPYEELLLNGSRVRQPESGL